MILVDLGVVLVCIVIGVPVGGIGLGTLAGLGLVSLVFAFDFPPGVPPDEDSSVRRTTARSSASAVR
jgi:anaerobic C4-dicarboxylate transporter